MINNFLFVIILLTGTYCTDYTYLFRENAQGFYKTITDNIYFSIDAAGDMAGTAPATQMFFYQAKSDTDAVYRKKENGKNVYVPIRINGSYLYFNSSMNSSADVSFKNMIKFAEKISLPGY